MFSEAIKKYREKHGFEAFAPKAVLFDMDGVLFDSMPYHASSWASVSEKFGLGMTPEEAYMHEGRTGESTINLLACRSWGREATSQEREEIYAEKCRLFNEYPEAPKMQGAVDVLSEVKALGLTIAVVTGSGQQSLLERLQTGFPGYFSLERVVSSKDVAHGKPSPEPYLLALERLGLEPWQAIVVENAPLGVRSAVAARIFTIAVNTGPLSPELLADENPDLILPSMPLLATLIREEGVGQR